MPNASALRDTHWASQTCIVGLNTVGVWAETNESTDIKVCARSNNRNLLVTGDDMGNLKLFSSPAIHLKVTMLCIYIHSIKVYLTNDLEIFFSLFTIVLVVIVVM